jgi:hypothetical protein
MHKDKKTGSPQEELDPSNMMPAANQVRQLGTVHASLQLLGQLAHSARATDRSVRVQEIAPGQQFPLSTERIMSTIPKVPRNACMLLRDLKYWVAGRCCRRRGVVLSVAANVL